MNLADKNVKKSESLIKSRYNLSPISLKLISLVIASVSRYDKEDQEYIIPVKDFSDMIGTTAKNMYEIIDSATEELLSNTIKIPRENGKGFIKFNWVSKAEYRYGEGIVVFRIDKDLRPYLIEAKEKYLSYKLQNILRLKSSYSIKLYEYLKDFYNTNRRYKKQVECTFLINTFREQFLIPDSYRNNDIKKLVDKTVKELNEKTDLVSFSSEFVKQGRKFVKIKFSFSEL